MFTDGDDSVVQRNAQKAEKIIVKTSKNLEKNQGATPNSDVSSYKNSNL